MQNSKNLDDQLLPGLKTKGVSKSYSGSIKPFIYNDINSLKKIFEKKNHNIGVVIMEPMRGSKPIKNFFKRSEKNYKKK